MGLNNEKKPVNLSLAEFAARCVLHCVLYVYVCWDGMEFRVMTIRDSMWLCMLRTWWGQAGINESHIYMGGGAPRGTHSINNGNNKMPI